METRKITPEELYDRIGKEPLYFYYDFEDAVIRSEYNGKTVDYYVKFRGKREFKAVKGSGVVTEALLTPVVISKEDYDKY